MRAAHTLCGRHSVGTSTVGLGGRDLGSASGGMGSQTLGANLAETYGGLSGDAALIVSYVTLNWLGHVEPAAGGGDHGAGPTG